MLINNRKEARAGNFNKNSKVQGNEESLSIVQITAIHVQATVDHRTNEKLSKNRAIDISKSLVQMMGQQIQFFTVLLDVEELQFHNLRLVLKVLLRVLN